MNGVSLDITAREKVTATLQGVNSALRETGAAANDAFSGTADNAGAAFEGLAGQILASSTALTNFNHVAMAVGTALGNIAGTAALAAVTALGAAIREWATESSNAEMAWRSAIDSIDALGSGAEARLHQMELRARGWSSAMLAAVDVMNKAKTVKLPDGREMSGNEALVEAGIQVNALREKYDRLKESIPAARNLANEDANAWYGDLRKINAELEKWLDLRSRIEAVESGARGSAANVDRIQAETRARESAAREAKRLAEQAARDAERRAEQESRARGRELERLAQEAKRANAEIEREEDRASAQRGKDLVYQYQTAKKLNDQLAREEKAHAREREREIHQYTNRMVSSFTSGLAKMAQDEMTFSQFSTSIWHSMEGVALSVIDKWITAWIVGKLTTKAADQVASIAEVTHQAGVAGAGAAASQASIPFIGPMLAVSAMEATSAAVMGSMLPLASAAGGFYDIPRDQLVYTHAKEQILPAEYAEGLRQLIESGGGGGGLNVTIRALDAAGVEQALRSNKSSLVKVLRELARAGRG